MPYAAETHKDRLHIIDIASNVFAQINVATVPESATLTRVEGSTPAVHFGQTNEAIGSLQDHHVFNMPFLLLKSGMPWTEANSFLYHLVINKHPNTRPTDHARRCASKLLSFIMFCETNGLDWLDFSGKRPSSRPTYMYFYHLHSSTKKSSSVINQHTGVVYEFYKHVAKHWHDIDISRVDTITAVNIYIKGRNHKVVKRSQTKKTPLKSSVPAGFIREHGEDLRPLTNRELKEFMEIINTQKWSSTERLIQICSLFTGARKQSVLTIRMKHLEAFKNENLNRDGTYTLHAGPGTDIDTKFDKKQQLYFPKQLAEEILIYANSKHAKSRRDKFTKKYNLAFPNSKPIADEDIYLFLSDQGGCYYMGKNDPRYPIVNSPQTGQVTNQLKRKLLRLASEGFPKGFRYHWLRATYAYQYYQWLAPFVDNGYLSLSEQISMIQNRLHHTNRETTEEYLKLFNNIDEILKAQESWEKQLFGDLALHLQDGPYGGESYANQIHDHPEIVSGVTSNEI